MRIIDLHQDILLHQRDQTQYKHKEQTSLGKILNSNISIVFGTGFVFGENQLESIQEDIDEYIQFANKYTHVCVIKNKDDLQSIDDETDKKGIIIHIEGLNTFEDTSYCWDMLENFYQKGLRSIGIVWTKENPLGGGNDSETQGLTELGKKVILWAQERNILIDYAHMNEKTFCDVAKISKKPIFVSHGNAKAICQNNRNYTDEQLMLVKNSGGLVGVFFANSCLVSEGQATIDDVVRHIVYMRNLIGIEYVALGSDLGGLTLNIPENLRNIFELNNLENALLKHGFTQQEIDKVLYSNAMRFLKENI